MFNKPIVIGWLLIGSLYKLSFLRVMQMECDGRKGNADNGIIYFVLSRCESMMNP